MLSVVLPRGGRSAGAVGLGGESRGAVRLEWGTGLVRIELYV